jgi:hypothetical protein
MSHVADVATTGENNGADGDDGDPAAGQLDAEDEEMELPT